MLSANKITITRWKGERRNENIYGNTCLRCRDPA